MSRYRTETPPAGSSAPDDHDNASSFVPNWSSFSGLNASNFSLRGVGSLTRDLSGSLDRQDGPEGSRRNGSSSRERDAAGRGGRRDSTWSTGAGESNEGSSWNGPSSFAARLRFTAYHQQPPQSGSSSGGIGSFSASPSSPLAGYSPQRARLSGRHLVMADATSPLAPRKPRAATAGQRVPLVAMALAPSPKGRSATDRRLAVAGRRELRVLKLSERDTEPEGTRIKMEEIVDLRAGTGLSSAYGTSDLAWGYASTSEKIAMSCTNGAVVGWNLERQQGGKMEFTKFEHTRTVNRVGFGAPGGNWLVSAAHDGLAKLWDLRDTRPSQLFVQTHGDPIRHFRLHPNRTAEPFSLALLTDTGYLFNFDLRNAAKGHLSRIAAHTGAGLGLDWRVASDGSGASWLASGGVDGLVKVWDMNSPTPALLRTLNVARPVQDVVWRPGKPTELAVTTLAAVGGGVVRTGPTVRGGTPTSTFASVAMEDPGTGDVDLAESREGDFEIWDIRRESVPKFVVRDIVWSSTDTFLTTHKTTSSVVQHDVSYNPECPLDELPRQAVAWSATGSLAFAADEERWDEVPFDETREPWSVEAFRSEQMPVLTTALAPTADATTFRYLALNSIVDGQSFVELCQHNSATAKACGRLDLWQLWQDLSVWFAEDVETKLLEDDPDGASRLLRRHALANKMAPTSKSTRRPHTVSASPRRRVPQSLASPTSVAPRQRISSSGSRSRTSSRYNSPSLGPVREVSSTDNISSLGDLDLEGRSEAESIRPKGSTKLALASGPRVSSSSEEDDPGPAAPSTYSANPGRLALSLSNLKLERPSALRRRSSSILGSGAPTPRANRSSFLPTTREGSGPEDASRASASSRVHSLHGGSSSESEVSATGTARKEIIQRRLARRTQGTGKGPDTTSGTDKLESRKARRSYSKDGIASKMHVRGASSSDLASMIAAVGTHSAQISEEALNTLRWKAALKRDEIQLNRGMQAKLRTMVAAQAERGEVQAAVTMARVLQDRSEVSEEILHRWTRAYLKLLERHQLFEIAAEIRRSSGIEDVRALSLEAAVRSNAACGACGKAMEEPAAVCPRCRADYLECSICHLPFRDAPMTFCSACGHGSHRLCLSNYLLTLGISPSTHPPPTPHQTLPSPSSPTSPISPSPLPLLSRRNSAALLTPTPPSYARSLTSGTTTPAGGPDTPTGMGIPSPGFAGAWFWGSGTGTESPPVLQPRARARQKKGVAAADRKRREAVTIDEVECPTGCGHRGCLRNEVAALMIDVVA